MIMVCSAVTKPTAAALAKGLSILYAENPDTRHRDVVRWGATQGIGYRPTGRVYNGRDAIIRAISKTETAKTLARAGIACIPWQDTPHDTFPQVQRIDGLSRGRGITIHDSLEHLDDPGPGRIYAPYIPHDREYRIHVVDQCPIHCLRKMPRDKDNPPQVWNRDNCTTRHAPKAACRHVAAAAVAALGLDFGCVDILVDRDDHAHVLEVNTAPGLCRTSGEKWIYHMAQLLNLDVDLSTLDDITWPGNADTEPERETHDDDE